MSSEFQLNEKLKIVVWMDYYQNIELVQSLFQETFSKPSPDSAFITKLYEAFCLTGSIQTKVQSTYSDSETLIGLDTIERKTVEITEDDEAEEEIVLGEHLLKEKLKSRPNIHVRQSSTTVNEEKHIFFNRIRKEEIKDFTEISVDEGSSAAVVVETFKKNFICIHCGFKSESEVGHSKHMKVHSSLGFFECEQCSFTCNNTNALRSHKLQCQPISKNASNLSIIINEHLTEDLECNECGVACSSKTALTQHQSLHSPLRPFACDKCTYKFLTEKSLLLHKANHEKIKRLECPDCSFRCNLSKNMVVHSRIHSNEKPFRCSECEYSCTNPSNLKLHQSCHRKEKSFPCDKCDFTTHRSSLLISHKRVHNNYNDFKYSCQICDIKFNRARGLQYHMKRFHVKQELLECPFCDYRQREKVLLKIHIRRHTGEKPYACLFPLCSYKGMRAHDLKKHTLKEHSPDNAKAYKEKRFS